MGTNLSKQNKITTASHTSPPPPPPNASTAEQSAMSASTKVDKTLSTMMFRLKWNFQVVFVQKIWLKSNTVYKELLLLLPLLLLLLLLLRAAAAVAAGLSSVLIQ